MIVLAFANIMISTPEACTVYRKLDLAQMSKAHRHNETLKYMIKLFVANFRFIPGIRL